LPNGRQSGLIHARSILRQVEGIEFADFSHLDVVRHPLVQEVITAYERAEAGAGSPPTTGGPSPAEQTS
jgi:phosphate starvation-inducible PhoH-like protein